MIPSKILDVLRIGIPNQRNFLLVGGPGVGKTDVCKQAAKLAVHPTFNLNYECQIFHPVWSDPTDPKGMPWVFVPKESDAPKAEFIPFGDLRRLLEATVPTVAVLDDLGQAAPMVQASYMPWLLERRINGKKFPDYVTFLACTNRREQKSAVTGILEPVKSRFASIINFETDTEDWVKWAIEHDIDPIMRAFIRFRPELLCDFVPTGDMTNSPIPRTVANVARLYTDKYAKETEEEIYAGAAGEAFAIQFLAFAKIFRKLVNPKKVIQDPEDFKIPAEPDVLYALCGAVANLATEDSMSSIVKFAERLAIGTNFDDGTARSEFAVLLIRDSCNHDIECRNTREYIEWQTKNPDIVV